MIYKYEIHSHTQECHLGATLGAADLVRAYKDAGYDGIVITDHYIERFYTRWYVEDIEGRTHQEQVKRLLRGYYIAKEVGDQIGLTVLPGIEVRFDTNPNDYLIYGLHEAYFYTVPRLNECANLQELLSLLPADVCVVQAHPFRDDMVVQSPDGLFGIEVYNGGTDPFRNELARLYAQHYGLPMTSGSDIHDLCGLAKGGIMTERRIRTPEDLIAVLRSGEYSLITP